MALHEEIRELLADTPSAELRRGLGVSDSTLSQWKTGELPCAERYLARLVDQYHPSLDPDPRKRGLLRLFLLRLRDRFEKHGPKDKCTAAAKQLAYEAIDLGLSWTEVPTVAKSRGRTLRDFPEAFYPLTIVSGDKREDSESRITAADFGAVSASPAEARWIITLQLRGDVEFLTDKVCVLENYDELCRRLGERNILIMGSPGSNHLARRCLLPSPQWRRAVPIFRFNMSSKRLQQIEDLLSSLMDLNTKQLVGRKGDPETDQVLSNWLHHLFQGGILDPSYYRHNLWLRGEEVPTDRDFGLVSLARNPFSKDDRFVCILAAGFHMFGTAHAIKMLADRRNFDGHPLGGVVRVNMYDKEFARRFDTSLAEWDADSTYDVADVLTGLDRLSETVKASGLPTSISVTEEEIRECHEFIDAL